MVHVTLGKFITTKSIILSHTGRCSNEETDGDVTVFLVEGLEFHEGEGFHHAYDELFLDENVEGLVYAYMYICSRYLL